MQMSLKMLCINEIENINPLLWYYYSVAFNLWNTRVYSSIFVFSILVTIRVVHLKEQLSPWLGDSSNMGTEKRWGTNCAVRNCTWLKVNECTYVFSCTVLYFSLETCLKQYSDKICFNFSLQLICAN